MQVLFYAPARKHRPLLVAMWREAQAEEGMGSSIHALQV